jgi:hypothetical protein
VTTAPTVTVSSDGTTALCRPCVRDQSIDNFGRRANLYRT